MQHVLTTVAVIKARLSMRGGRGQDHGAMERRGGRRQRRGLGDQERGAPSTTSAGPALGEGTTSQRGRKGLPKLKAKPITDNRDPVLNEGI